MNDPNSAIKTEYVRRAIMSHAAAAGYSVAEVAARCKVHRVHFYRYLANPDNWPTISKACGEPEGWLKATALSIQVKWGTLEHMDEAVALLEAERGS